MRKKWTRTCVPDQRPREIGDQVKGSVIIGHPAWAANRTVAEVRSYRDYTLAVDPLSRNATSPPDHSKLEEGTGTRSHPLRDGPRRHPSVSPDPGAHGPFFRFSPRLAGP